MLTGPWPWIAAAGYATLLLAIHAVAARGTSTIDPAVKHRVGSDAATTWSRPWAPLTSQFFHNDRFHILYNVAVTMATLPWALQAYGLVVFPIMVAANFLTMHGVHLALVGPLRHRSRAAAGIHAGRIVGASIAIFAGAGIAWTAWQGPLWAKAAALGAVTAYEVGLVVAGKTGPFVAVYHLGGATVGIGLATWLL